MGDVVLPCSDLRPQSNPKDKKNNNGQTRWVTLKLHVPSAVMKLNWRQLVYTSKVVLKRFVLGMACDEKFRNNNDHHLPT